MRRRDLLRALAALPVVGAVGGVAQVEASRTEADARAADAALRAYAMGVVSRESVEEAYGLRYRVEWDTTVRFDERALMRITEVRGA